MYGATWCGDCEFNYFPWKNGQEKGHKCVPTQVKKILLSKITSSQEAITGLEKQIEGYRRKIEAL